MPDSSHCNSCQKGIAEFVGHHYDDKKDKCFSVYKCISCGAKHYQPWKFSFDLEHPKALPGMLATDDYMKRIHRQW
jgi:hypothetical protein